MRIVSRGPSQSHGFTLIELLVVMGITSILAMTSLQSYGVFRKLAYDAESERLRHDVFTALEAGKSNYEDSVDEWFWVGSNMDGSVSGWHNSMNGDMEQITEKELLPGVFIKPEMRLFVSYDTWCNASNYTQWGCQPNEFCCITETVQAYHCKGGKVKSIQRWNNGQTWEMEWDNWVFC